MALENIETEDINNYVKDKLVEKKIKFCDDSIKEYQKKYEKENYDGKLTKNDKVTCVVCGGTYIKSVKCIHDKTKKHQKKLQEIYDFAVNN